MFDNIPVWLTFTLGFSAQAFFGLRTALQWLKSEMAHESVSPVVLLDLQRDRSVPDVHLRSLEE